MRFRTIATTWLLLIALPGLANDIKGGDRSWQMPVGHEFTTSGWNWIYDSSVRYLSISPRSYPQGPLPAAVSVSGSASLQDSNGNYRAGYFYFMLGWYDCSYDFHVSNLTMVPVAATGHQAFTFTDVVDNPCPTASPIWVEIEPVGGTAVIDSTDQFTMGWQSH